MISKKGYALPDEIGQDLIKTMDIAKNNTGTMNFRLIPIDSIEFDPENPRELRISKDDIIDGLKKEDPYYDEKSKELESLQQMSETIKKFGVRNPIEIYKNGPVYRLIHGERRCLSSLLASKTEIPAKILYDAPNTYEIKMLQLIENVQREDLSLIEYMNNIRAVIQEYKKSVDPNIEINAKFIEKIINKSRAQCFNILTVLNAPIDVQKCISEGKIKNLEKAAVIANESSDVKRKELINLCVGGASLANIKKSKEKMKLNLGNKSNFVLSKGSGRQPTKVLLGETRKISVIVKLIDLVLKDPQYKPFKKDVIKEQISDFKSCSKAFKALLNIMEDVEDD